MLTDELLKGKTPIDREQRRYEVAREIYCTRINETNTPEDMVANRAVKLADVLIKALRGY